MQKINCRYANKQYVLTKTTIAFKENEISLDICFIYVINYVNRGDEKPHTLVEM